MRALAVTVLFALAVACSTTHGVYHVLPLPASIGAVADGVVMSVVEDQAHAAVAFGEGLVTLASVWHGAAPAAVARAFALQLELAVTLRRRYPVLPVLGEWPVEWVGVDADEALRQRVLLGRAGAGKGPSR